MRNDREYGSSPDDADLVELIEGLWQRKLLVFGVALLVTLVATAYALLATPIYQARVIVEPPTQNDIASLNYGRGGEGGLSLLATKDVYEVYLRTLTSESLRREFFRKIYLPAQDGVLAEEHQDELYAEYISALQVALTSKGGTAYTIAASVPSPQQAAEWVSIYAGMAGDWAKQEVLKDAASDVVVRAESLERQIRIAQDSARKQREDQIAVLREALAVAESIGLERPMVFPGGSSAEMHGALTYMRGSKALMAEIEALERRESDDPFIASLRSQQAALAYYRSQKVDPSTVAVYRQDGSVELLDKPISPKKALIIAAGMILGLFLGVGLGMVLRVLEVHRKRRLHPE